MSHNITLPNGHIEKVVVAYTMREVQGVTVLVVASSLTLVAVVGLLGVIALSAFNTRFSKNDALFVRTHIAVYFISLLLTELIGAIGSIMSARWVNEMAASVGVFCTFQGILKHVADVGTATWAVVIAIHTFCVLFLHWKPQAYARWLTLVSGWAFIGAIAMAGPASVDRVRRGRFHGISGYWCWIADEYEAQRITLDYLIMFLFAFLSFVFYALVYLRLRGNIVLSGGKLSFHTISDAKKNSWGTQSFEDKQLVLIARQMMLYPIAYTLIIVPIAAARFSYWAGHDVPFQVTIFCDTIYLLSGVVNVVMFATTRRVIPRRSVLKLVISRPSVEEPDWIDPDEYYPEDARQIHDTDIEKGSVYSYEPSPLARSMVQNAMNEPPMSARYNARTPISRAVNQAPISTPKAAKTPIFHRNESGMWVSDDHDMAHSSHARNLSHSESEYDSDAQELEMDHNERPVLMDGQYVPQMVGPSEEENGVSRESLYDLYGARPASEQPPPMPTSAHKYHYKKRQDVLEDVSLE